MNEEVLGTCLFEIEEGNIECHSIPSVYVVELSNQFTGVEVENQFYVTDIETPYAIYLNGYITGTFVSLFFCLISYFFYLLSKKQND